MHATWLAPTVLLVAGSTGEVGAPETIGLLHEGEPLESESHSESFSGPDDPESQNCTLLLFLVRAENGRSPDGLELTAPGGGSDQLTLDDLQTDLRTFARERLAPLDPELRSRVLEWLNHAAANELRSPALSESLFAIRQAVRERSPLRTSVRARPLAAHVDRLLRVDDRAFYVRGWLRDEEAEVTRLTAVSPEGARSELLDGLYHEPRRDIEEFFSDSKVEPAAQFGFISFFTLPSPSRRSTGWLLEAEDSFGTAVEIDIPDLTTGTENVRERLLGDIMHAWPPVDELISGHVEPAISRIQAGVQKGLHVESVVQYGDPPPSPAVSVIVPLYQRIDHLELQLSRFAGDEELRSADLIYVLDSPEREEELRHVAAHLFPVYEVPFRVAFLRQNAGFAGANNAGASVARGDLLLLMNSDVLPIEPGWVGRLRSFHESKSGIGALGPKLLYDDDSIQHAGMYYYRPPGSPFWQDAHFFKGLHKSFPDANVPRPVPVVSGACTMISSRLYAETGLRGIHVRGDYEDNDLCLRLLGAGLQNWYTPDAELFHLEAQSYSGDSRLRANRFNMWLHNHLWGDRIEDLMSHPESWALPSR